MTSKFGRSRGSILSHFSIFPVGTGTVVMAGVGVQLIAAIAMILAVLFQ